MVRSVDDQVGRVVAYLKEKGLYDNTIIVYMGDQGFFLGEHGLYDKRWMYEEALQMPCLISYPNGMKKRRKKTGVGLPITSILSIPNGTMYNRTTVCVPIVISLFTSIII